MSDPGYFLYSILAGSLHPGLQSVKAEEALSQRFKPSKSIRRGRILDRNGTRHTASSNSIFVRPQDLKDPQKAAAKLA